MENDRKWQPPRHSAGVGRAHFYGNPTYRDEFAPVGKISCSWTVIATRRDHPGLVDLGWAIEQC